MTDFRLESEPWIFIVDAQGKIAARYDGIVSESELEEGLKATLAAS